MTPTKEQQAQEYAEKKNNERLSAYPEAMRPDLHPEYDINDIAQAYIDGYTACEQSMWRSVEEELPSNYADVLASDENGLHIASYFNGEWYSVDDEFTRQPQMWMPIPPIPETNTEKI